jgi:oligosaccharyltransferase complex subunit alpha (ribophorin I)
MNLKLLTNCLLLLIALKAILISSQNTDVINGKVDRVIDISSQLVRITTRIVVDNSANKKSLDNYLIVLDESHRNLLSFISATIDKKALQLTKVDDKSWRLDLSGSNAIPAGLASSGVIEVEAVFTHLLSPYPSEILQSERQLVVYEGNHYFLSPYQTKTQTTKVKLTPSGTIESFSKLKPTAQNDRTISYGPYENIAPNSFSQMRIHSENNSPFLTVTKLERNIEVSHWAAIISVEETIDVKHTGALLKGPFSRYEFQREPTNGISSIKSWKTKLPATARDIYYRDEIGNISTSNLKSSSNYVIAELRPRFPLFGGWKTHYVLGYYVPTQDLLFNDGNEFALKIPFVDHIFDNMVIEEATIKVILPEGASDIKLRLPYSVTRDRDQTHYTYLDTIGRTVLVLHKTNLVEQHIQDFEVHYTYHKIFMLQEPLLVVVAIFALCILVIIYVRLDFSITKNPQKHTLSKISAINDQILKHQDKRASIYEQFDKASVKFKVCLHLHQINSSF